MEDCQHKDFVSKVNVFRLTDNEDKNKIISYTVEVSIKCKDCNLPFEFVRVGGLRHGLPHSTISFDSTILYTPVRPSSDPVGHINVILNK